MKLICTRGGVILLLGLFLAACLPINLPAYSGQKVTPSRVIPAPAVSSTAEAEAGHPRVCAETIASPAPFGTLEPVAINFTGAGYAAEWFVAPGAFNMPQEVLITPQGDLLVQSVRNSLLFRVAADGTVTRFATDSWGYLGTVDAGGNLYLHSHPGGVITRISPNGVVTTLVRSPEIQSACDSGFGIGPDGNLYLALFRCEATSDLIQITPEGRITTVARSILPMNAIRAAPDGRLLGAGENIYEISLQDFSIAILRPVPEEPLSPGGLAVDDEGNIYLSTGSRSSSGRVYRITPAGASTLIAEIPENGLSGIEWMPETQEIVGGQLRQGGLIAVSMDGSLRTIVPGNGIITPMGMAFSPCGDLVVANDDGGMMTLVDPAGEVSWFFDYPSFTPPTPFVAFASDGTLFASVGAPGMPEGILAVEPGGTPGWLARPSMPCGLAYRQDGILFVAETSTGRIVMIDPAGSKTTFVEGLKFPQDLALDSEGNLYVITGPAGFTGNDTFKTPNVGDAILRIRPDGSVNTLAYLEGVAALAVSPEGELFAASGSRIMHVAVSGSLTPFADGLRRIRGLAFDLAGNLYAADETLNGIVRIGGFPQGTINGFVTDASGRLVAGARVQMLSGPPGAAGQVVMTGADGGFRLPAAPRTYTIVVSADGYKVATLEEVQVFADQETELQIELMSSG